jgi:hypothetical protein
VNKCLPHRRHRVYCVAHEPYMIRTQFGFLIRLDLGPPVSGRFCARVMIKGPNFGVPDHTQQRLATPRVSFDIYTEQDGTNKCGSQSFTISQQNCIFSGCVPLLTEAGTFSSGTSKLQNMEASPLSLSAFFVWLAASFKPPGRYTRRMLMAITRDYLRMMQYPSSRGSSRL